MNTADILDNDGGQKEYEACLFFGPNEDPCVATTLNSQSFSFSGAVVHWTLCLKEPL
jgi:hypothetical protein